eukprot:TRINITY_DN1625_c2_g1_i2.p1 TRINITY_DN1625_c2_g1~~TRINITY_DN1625_c2_g1_i2.p1  ORF type:complete len:171 (+),score=32.22 TRINITY_DN1625_c2_g1_i2:31-513(+)
MAQLNEDDVDWVKIDSLSAREWDEVCPPSPRSSASEADSNERLRALELQNEQLTRELLEAKENNEILYNRLLSARVQVRELQLTVSQQNDELDSMRTGLLLYEPDENNTTILTTSERRRLRQVRSKAVQSVAPQSLRMEKRQVWNKSNHRTHHVSASRKI